MILITAIAYLLGSIPFGLLLTRAAGMGDIRKEGSGNIGATNVLRVGGKKLGAAVLLLDMGKGALAIGVAHLMVRSNFAVGDAPYGQLMLVALYAVILGHVFPVWLKFKGGKGVATLFGALLALDLTVGLLFALAWLGVYFLTRYVSLASILATGGAVVYATVDAGHGGVMWYLLPLFLLIAYTHRTNIERLLNGTEHRFSRTKS